MAVKTDGGIVNIASHYAEKTLFAIYEYENQYVSIYIFFADR